MSDQQMANRIHGILSAKAALGMGYGGDDVMGYGDEELVAMDHYGRGVMAGANKRKAKKKPIKSLAKKKAAETNPWVIFIRGYADEHGISYRQALMDKNASKEYCNLVEDVYEEVYERGTCGNPEAATKIARAKQRKQAISKSKQLTKKLLKAPKKSTSKRAAPKKASSKRAVKKTATKKKPAAKKKPGPKKRTAAKRTSRKK